MKNWKYVLTVFTALALLAAPAHGAAPESGPGDAAPPEEGVETAEGASASLPEDPAIFTLESEPPELMNEKTRPAGEVSLLGSAWTGTRYRDQLPQNMRSIYDELEQAFEAGDVTYEDRTFMYQDDTGKTWTETDFCAVYRYRTEIASISAYDPNLNAEFDALQEQYDPDLFLTWLAFTYDHPEYFWIRYDGAGRINFELDRSRPGDARYTIFAEFVYVIREEGYLTPSGRQAAQRAVNSAAEEILAQCEGLSVIEKLAWFDNWLAVNNQYNYAAAGDGMGETGPIPWNAAAALLPEYSPVCEGYAKALQLLCHRSKVPCVPVSSADHMWNMVQVDGEWYHMDCTWNDPAYDQTGKGYSLRTYFLIATFAGKDPSAVGGSHAIRPILACPPAAAADYFPASPGWTKTGGKITGYLSQSAYAGNIASRCLFALYDDQGRLLSVLPCGSIPWGSYQTRFLVPEFASGVLDRTSSGKSFLTGEGWNPLAGATDMAIQ